MDNISPITTAAREPVPSDAPLPPLVDAPVLDAPGQTAPQSSADAIVDPPPILTQDSSPRYVRRRPPTAGVEPFPWGSFLFIGSIIGIVLAVTANYNPIVAGVIYAVVFLTLAFARQEFALLLIFASSFFQNDLSLGLGPVHFSIAELNLALTLPVVIAQAVFLRRKLTVGPILIPVALYFGVCILASLRDMKATTIVSLGQMFLYLIATVVIFSSVVRRPQLLLIPLTGCVAVGVVMAIFGLATNFTIFNLHKNGWGGSLAAALVVAIELWFAATDVWKKRVLLGCVAVLTAALMFCVSRGGWLAAMAGLFTLVALRRQYKLLARSVFVLVPLIGIFWFLMPEDSREYALGFEESRENVKTRMESLRFALDKFHESPLIGCGVGLRKEFDATNIILTTLAETGLVGTICFLLIHIAFLRMVWITQASLSRSNPLFPLVSLGAALVVGRLAHGMVDHYWSRGAITPAWAAAGMATAIYYLTRAPRRARPRRIAASSQKPRTGPYRALQFRP